MRYQNKFHSQLTLFIILPFFTATVAAQSEFGWVMPLDSPAASVSQTIGVTEITINYHRPAVKGRKIWGGLEPYDKVWRAGANEATTISFSTDVKIEDQPLTAGTYALFLIPAQGEWTLIFNKTAKQWGAFAYKEADDALRIKVTPQANGLQEELQFSFPTANNEATTVAFQWEKIKLSFKITADTPALTTAKARKTFNHLEAFWAANYYLRAKTDLEEGLRWVNASLALNPGDQSLVSTHLMKARILGLLKRYDEALQTAEQAFAYTGKTQNPAGAKAMIEKVITDLKKLKG